MRIFPIRRYVIPHRFSRNRSSFFFLWTHHIHFNWYISTFDTYTHKHTQPILNKWFSMETKNSITHFFSICYFFKMPRVCVLIENQYIYLPWSLSVIFHLMEYESNTNALFVLHSEFNEPNKFFSTPMIFFFFFIGNPYHSIESLSILFVFSKNRRHSLSSTVWCAGSFRVGFVCFWLSIRVIINDYRALNW